jgi:hypothetical protein
LGKKVLIGSYLNSASDIIREFINSLENLKTDDLEIEYFFGQCTVTTLVKKIIDEFKLNNHKKINLSTDFKATEIFEDDFFNENLNLKIANFKNQLLKYTLENDFDYLFLINSALVFAPQTLAHLISANKDIISEVFRAGDKSVSVWLYDDGQILNSVEQIQLNDENKKNIEIEFKEKLKVPGIYEVGGVSDCILIKRQVIEKGVNFEKLKNLNYIYDNAHFCIRAVALGFEIYADTHYPPLFIEKPENVSILKEN